MQDVYDLVVIGAGPGGYVGAIRAAQLGMRTAIVERNKLGGTCLHLGCIPTKALLQVAELLEEMRRAREFGIRVEEPSLDMTAVQRYKDRVVNALHRGVEYLMRKNGIAVFQGTARLVGRERVHVSLQDGSETELRTQRVLLATGSVPRSIPGVTVDGSRILTSDHVVGLQEVPRRLGILGAGAIGVEFASVFRTFGSEVTMLELLPRVPPGEDEEVSEALRKALERRGIQIHTEVKLQRVEPAGGGLRLVADQNGTPLQVEVDVLLVAVGRAPHTEGLGLEAVGVEVDQGGFIRADARMRTNVEGIWAIGDVVHPVPMLAHVASEEAVVAVEDMAGRTPRPMDYLSVPRCTYSLPEVASFGLTETQAREQGYQVRVGRFPFAANSKAGILGIREGFVKIVTDARYGEILGVHMIGPRVTELLPEGVLARNVEATAEELVQAIHAHPTLSEAVREAALDALGRVIHT
ncbi:MAG: dihydrolipoyl dehydrogenase [Armatimonadota bacterium]|nr:dihydrolipoyl dehydrogenase [Armatimonadota bacterium]